MKIAAVVLAGGAAARLGGSAKPYLSVAGRPLLSRVLDACASVAASPVVVVGPAAPASLREEFASVRWTREEPPGGGPARAIAAGLAALAPDAPDAVLLMAGDMPYAEDGVAPLVAAASHAVRHGEAGAWGVADGVFQPLFSCVHTGALRRLGLEDGGSVFTALRTLGLTEVPVPSATVADADTWDDLTALRKEATMTESRLSQWVATAAAEAGVPTEFVDVDAVLDVAREAAHNVERPAAPVTTFLLGYAAAAEGLDAAGIAALADRLGALARAQAVAGE